MKTFTRFYPVFLLSVVVFLIHSAVMAQMSGTYHIGADAGDDFESFQEAVDSLESQGVNGPVNILVDAGTYDEQVEINMISGTSSDNTVTFQSATGDSTDVVLMYEATDYNANHVVKMFNTSHLTFRSITFHAKGTSYGRGVILEGVSNNITFTHCRFKGFYNTNNRSEHASVFSTGQLPDSLYFYDNLFDSVTIAIYLNSANSNVINEVEIVNNTFRDIGYQAIFFSRIGRGTIDNNEITGCYSAIRSSTSYSNAVITNNRIICKQTGILYTSVQYLPEPGLIANNHIFITDDAGHCRGLSIGGFSPVNIYHNTVILGDGGLDDYALYINNFPVNDAVNVINNILACYHEGVPFNNDYQLCPVDTLDYNCYYTAGKFMGRDHGKWLFNLEDVRNQFGQDQHSFTAYPVFSPDTSVYPLTAWVNDKGLPLPGMDRDIDGEPRDPAHPDIGAAEFTPSSHVTTPYAGDYTVGGGGSFSNLQQAIDSLRLKGISDEVRLNFMNGTHITHVSIPAIPGTGPDKNLVLQSQSGNPEDVLIKYEEQSTDENGYVINCHGTDFMKVRNLSFKADKLEGPYSNYARVFKFFGGTENLSFTGNLLESVYDENNRPHLSIFFSNDMVHYYDSLVIASNEMKNCAVGIYFQSYGQMQQKKSVKAHILNNQLSNIGYKGFHFQNHNAPTFKNNVLDSRSIGMSLYNCINNTTITGNQVNAGNYYAIGITTCNAVDTSRGLIANNFITIPGSYDTQGINMLHSENYDIVYNSVHVTSDDGGASAIHTTDGSGHVVLNNIFTNVGGGYAAKYERASAIDSLDYNDYYTGGNNLAVWESTVCPDISALQSASGMDQNSVSVDPGFISDTDLHLNTTAVTELATPIPVVTTDIDGAIRDASSPDMGADEYGAVGNLPPELENPIADLTINEGSDTTAIARLDTVFTDPNSGDDLDYMVESDTSSVKAFVIDTVLKVKPDTNFFGMAEIIVTATDPAEEAVSDTFRLTVTNMQDVPVAVDDQDSTEINTYVDMEVLNNDFDPDNDTLKITHVTDGSNGSSGVLAGYVTLRYTPDPDFVGKDTISYGIRDGHGNYDTALVYITVSPVEEGFELTDINLDSISHASVAWGDYDADGDLDLLMTGWTGSDSKYITKIYQNNEGILEDTELNLRGVMAGSDKSCAWTDFNNDGWLDFIITGAKDGLPDEYYTMLYKQVEGIFVETEFDLHAVTSGSVDWGDYDHDGDYDLLINGKGSGSDYAGVYINKTNVSGAFEYNNYGFEPVWSSAANWADFDGDGDLDVLSTGLGGDRSQYRNDLTGFFKVHSVLNSVQGRTADIGDFDMDGDLDIVMAGDNEDTAYTCIFETVSHEDPDTWAYSLKSTIQDIKSGSVAWGDYDNDGDPDLIVSGTETGLEAHTVLYENHDGAFWPDEAGFPDLGRSAAAWADYDNDGDLDLLLTGWGEEGPVSNIYRNNRIQTNTMPETPTGLTVEAGIDSARLTWHAGSDHETAQEGLTYNLRMGTTPGGSEIISSLSLQNGYRQVPKMGNAGQDTIYALHGLQPNTTYYWSVQTVDNCFEGSAFAQESSFMTSAEPQPELIFVDVDASGNNNGTSWEDAFNSLQDALDKAMPGDSIWVAEGIYYPSQVLDLDNINVPDSREATFLIPTDVKLYGGFEGTESRLYERDPKANETILSGDIGNNGDSSDNAYHVVCFINTGNETILDGFTIAYGNSAEHTDEGEWVNECGAGIFNKSSGEGHFSNPNIVNCIIENNRAYLGGGMYNRAYSRSESSPVLTNCIIRGNVSGQRGGGIYFRIVENGICEPIMTNCLISGNRTFWDGGGLCFNGDPTKIQQPILKNCTFNGNYSALFGGGLAVNHMDPVIVNCILWNNRAGEKGDEGYFIFSSPSIIYCNIKDGLEGIETNTSNFTYQNNLESDPLFVSGVDPEETPTIGGDLHLLIGSPCIDAGLNDSVTVNIDLDGNDRIQNGTVDMGAFERPVSQGIIYVDQNASGNNDGTSWQNAFNNLQDALYVSDFGDSIWVAASYYYPDRGAHVDKYDRNASFVIPDGVKLYGGFDGSENSLEERDWKNNETFLTGNIGKEKDHSDNSRHVVRFINTENQTLLDGFIIIHGNSEKEDGQAGTKWPDENPDLFGAGIFIETTEWNSVCNPKIHHCIIKNNKAYMGAGLCIWSCYLSVNKPELLNCKIQGNKALDGGGLYIASEGKSCPVLINCLISGNAAVISGGGIDFFTSTSNAQTEENTILKNCTFIGNSAEWGGAVRMTNMGPVFANSILWNNLARNSGNEVHLHDATPTFTHCDIQGGAEAFGRGGSNSLIYHENLDEDPLFITTISPEDAPTLEGDFRIEEMSPCINAGLNDSVTVAVDLDGEPRIKNDTVDIGAYETEKPEDVPDNISSVIQNELKVYPNPTNGLLKIELNENSRVEMLKVMNINGTEMISRRVNEKTFFLDLSSYPGGVYLIRTFSNGGVSTMRVIKY